MITRLTAEQLEDIPTLLAEVERLTDELMKANDINRGFAESEREITTEVERLRGVSGALTYALKDVVQYVDEGELRKAKALAESYVRYGESEVFGDD